MDNLLEKLQALRGATIDDNMIAQLLAASAGSLEGVTRNQAPSGSTRLGFEDSNSVDDLLIASRAAEMELESMRRYFKTPDSNTRRGLDGLADEDVSSDSDDEVSQECKSVEKSTLDKILAKNALVPLNDAEEDDVVAEEQAEVGEVDFSSVPRTIMVPYGAKFIPLGKIHSVVDGLLVISDSDPVNETGHPQTQSGVACDVESLVFLSDSNPLTVIGMVVDTLGTVKCPIHLVLVTNKEDFSQLTSKGSLVGTSVCTLSSHAKVVEVDEVCGQAVIRGAPQLIDYEGDDDGAEEEETSEPLPLMDAVVPPPPANPPFGFGYSRAGNSPRR